MSARSRIKLLAVLVLCLGRNASAHRLDEYLQATRISVDLNRVGIEMDLTPGVAVAERVIQAIDRDHDQNISDAEAAAYAKDIVRDVSLIVDGRARSLLIEDYRFPTFAEMRSGDGVIRLRATVPLASAESGQHHIAFTNRHMSDMGAYLVNALVPADDRIRIRPPRRDVSQQEFSMDYTIETPPPSASLLLFAVVLGASALGVLYIAKRRLATRFA
jgi:hypothetical protein